jgi:hypothetical protein
MSSTSQFTTFSDLYQGLLKAIRSDRGNSATVEDAKRYINTALLDMHIGFSEKVPWALRDHTFTTTEAATLTISARNTSPGANANGVPTRNYGFGTGTVGLLSTGAKLHVTTSSIASSVGLETEIAGNISISIPSGEVTADVYSNALSVGDVLLTYRNDIELPDDFMRIASSTVRLGTRQLPVIGRIEFRHRFAGDTSLNRPMYATMIDSTDIALGLDNRKLRLHPIPNVVERGHMTYVTNLLAVSDAGVWQRDLQADTDTPIVPLRYRHAIFFHALYNWYRDKKDDVRSQEAKAEYVEIINRITNDTEAGQSNMSIRPVINQYRGKAKRPYNRRGGRRMDFGRFDRMYD